SNVSTTTVVQLQLDAWTHVACVYDGDTLELFVAGNVLACNHTRLAIDTAVQGGIGVGTAYTGGLDDVHVYGSALSASDICRLATGGTTCKSICPP
ncbi:MAG: LamG-like jellyroll fold domain-containing protein, partial [Acidobacteriota bacterium]